MVVPVGPTTYFDPQHGTHGGYVRKEWNRWPVLRSIAENKSNDELGWVTAGDSLESLGVVHWVEPGLPGSRIYPDGIIYEMVRYHGQIGFIPKVGGFYVRYA